MTSPKRQYYNQSIEDKMIYTISRRELRETDIFGIITKYDRTLNAGTQLFLAVILIQKFS